MLIVEDEDGVRELAARVLRDRGYEVVQARNGAEALASLRNGDKGPHLLLTDVVVPDMGTEELEREVHKVVPGPPYPLYVRAIRGTTSWPAGCSGGTSPSFRSPSPART